MTGGKRFFLLAWRQHPGLGAAGGRMRPPDGHMRRAGQACLRAAKARSAASRVIASSASPWAIEVKPAS